MQADNARDVSSARTKQPPICVFCMEEIDSPADRELHVSALGAPGEFHRACFEEYETAGP
jgi:hypothetical protein